jgi:hypothetical protein
MARYENQRRTPTDFVAQLTSAIAERLSGFGLVVETSEATTLIAKWASEQKFETSHVLHADDSQIGEVADALVTRLLAEIAEERPGTDPWAHEANIPFPLPILLMQNTYLSLCSNIALHNSANQWVRQANASINAISDCILEHITLDAPGIDTHQILYNGEMRNVYGQTIMIPQPALAFLARYYENVVFHIEKGLWLLEDSADEEERRATLSTLTLQAITMRNLNERFGRAAGPKKHS